MSSAFEAARAAVPYGLATVDLHRILVSFALDPSSPEYKAPLNAVHHSRGPAAPTDRAVVDLDVDTPYSYAWLDLRGGPVLLTMPPHDPGRYLSAEVFDLYSYIVGYVSPRATGCGGSTVVVRGPSAPGPDLDVDATFDCPTDLALVLVRTQLFDADDRPAVAALQDRVVVEPLGPPGELLHPPAPVDVRAPLDGRFLQVLDWMLRLMPRLPEDTGVRSRLAGLGCGIGAVDVALRHHGQGEEILAGLAAGARDVQARYASVRSSAEIFGSRRFFAGDHLSRAAGAYLGVLGNSSEEFLGVDYRGGSEERPFGAT